MVFSRMVASLAPLRVFLPCPDPKARNRKAWQGFAQGCTNPTCQDAEVQGSLGGLYCHPPVVFSEDRDTQGKGGTCVGRESFPGKGRAVRRWWPGWVGSWCHTGCGRQLPPTARFSYTPLPPFPLAGALPPPTATGSPTLVLVDPTGYLRLPMGGTTPSTAHLL